MESNRKSKRNQNSSLCLHAKRTHYKFNSNLDKKIFPLQPKENVCLKTFLKLTMKILLLISCLRLLV